MVKENLYQQQMDPNMKETGNLEKKMGREYIFLKMEQNMMDIFVKVLKKVMDK